MALATIIQGTARDPLAAAAALRAHWAFDGLSPDTMARAVAVTTHSARDPKVGLTPADWEAVDALALALDVVLADDRTTWLAGTPTPAMTAAVVLAGALQHLRLQAPDRSPTPWDRLYAAVLQWLAGTPLPGAPPTVTTAAARRDWVGTLEDTLATLWQGLMAAPSPQTVAATVDQLRALQRVAEPPALAAGEGAAAWRLCALYHALRATELTALALAGAEETPHTGPPLPDDPAPGAVHWDAAIAAAEGAHCPALFVTLNWLPVVGARLCGPRP